MMADDFVHFLIGYRTLCILLVWPTRLLLLCTVEKLQPWRIRSLRALHYLSSSFVPLPIISLTFSPISPICSTLQAEDPHHPLVVDLAHKEAEFEAAASKFKVANVNPVAVA